LLPPHLLPANWGKRPISIAHSGESARHRRSEARRQPCPRGRRGGQLGNRQAIRLLEISRTTGARIILLGDTRQTGAIEQGKPFWLMMRLGMPKAELKDPIRQEDDKIMQAVRLARLQNYDGSLGALDKVTSGETSEKLAESLVADWTRLRPELNGRRPTSWCSRMPPA
jgi:hypothetical protein